MKITIQNYQEHWAKDFLLLSDKIKNTLSAFPVSIEHIGSTSVPGLGAKPIIDIMIGVSSDEVLDKTIKPMLTAGFTYFRKHEPSWPERRFFVQLTPLLHEKPPAIIDIDDDDSYREHFISTANIHIVVKDTQDWKRHIAFRDFLKTHASHRDAYYQLKKKLSEMDFKDVIEYNDHKNDFIKAHEKLALAWYETNRK